MSGPALNNDETVLMSADGYQQRCNELESLRTDGRRELSARLREARQDGDLDDNPTLVELLQEQAQLEHRIAVLDAQLACAEIVDAAADGDAGLGSLVQVRDVRSGEVFEYELVGTFESEVGNGRVSIAAPVGKALTGQRAGARVEVMTPRGLLPLEVLSVRPRMTSQATA